MLSSNPVPGSGKTAADRESPQPQVAETGVVGFTPATDDKKELLANELDGSSEGEVVPRGIHVPKGNLSVGDVQVRDV